MSHCLTINLIPSFIGSLVARLFFNILLQKEKITRLVCEHVELFDLVVKYGAPIHTADNHGAYPIHYASQMCGDRSLEILKKFLEYQVDVNCLDRQRRTPFLWAASAGEDKQIRINKKEEESLGALDALRLLYKVGADPFHADKDSLTGKKNDT